MSGTVLAQKLKKIKTILKKCKNTTFLKFLYGTKGPFIRRLKRWLMVILTDLEEVFPGVEPNLVHFCASDMNFRNGEREFSVKNFLAWKKSKTGHFGFPNSPPNVTQKCPILSFLQWSRRADSGTNRGSTQLEELRKIQHSIFGVQIWKTVKKAKKTPKNDKKWK